MINKLEKLIQDSTPCKVRFTNGKLVIVNREYNADTDKGVLSKDISKLNKVELKDLQEFCVNNDQVLATGTLYI